MRIIERPAQADQLIICLQLDAETAAALLRDPTLVSEAAALVRERAPWVARDVRDQIVATVAAEIDRNEELIEVNLGSRPRAGNDGGA